MDMSHYIAGHKERFEDEERRREKFLLEAMNRAQQIAKELVSVFPGVHVSLFGSLTTDLYELTSDIDLAIKGLPEENYYKALKIAEEIAAPIPVDLVQVEYAPEALLKKINQERVSL